MGKTNNSDDYSRVYEEFVGDGTSFIGRIAYAFYKEAKRKKLLELKASNGNRNPSRATMRDFEDSCILHKEMYIAKATKALNDMVAGIIETDKEKIFKTYFRNDYDILKLVNQVHDDTQQINVNTKPVEPRPLWKELGVEVLGNLAWAALLILGSLFFLLNDDAKGYLEGAGRLLEKAKQEAKADTAKKPASLLRQPEPSR
jgi:hypothetical protein